MQHLWEKLPQLVRNTYFLLGISFFFWMLFFDSEDFITQYTLWRKLNNLQAEKVYYLEEIEKVRQDREELTSNEALLEKFAREKYFMKKKKEDLYIVVDE
jgi:cell division protein DivIC